VNVYWVQHMMGNAPVHSQGDSSTGDGGETARGRRSFGFAESRSVSAEDTLRRCCMAPSTPKNRDHGNELVDRVGLELDLGIILMGTGEIAGYVAGQSAADFDDPRGWGFSRRCAGDRGARLRIHCQPDDSGIDAGRLRVETVVSCFVNSRVIPDGTPPARRYRRAERYL
jgi:hypothetical protein